MNLLHLFNKQDTKIDIETFLEKLSSLVDLEVLQEIVKSTSDRRLLLKNIAKSIEDDERVFLKKLAKKLGLKYEDILQGVDLRDVIQPLKISALRQYGIMPIILDNKVLTFACCDPSYVPEEYLSQIKSSLVLAKWDTISNALTETEMLSSSKNTDNLEDAKNVLDLAVEEANNYEAKKLSISFANEKITYEFRTAEGQFGKGEINYSIRTSLDKILSSAVNLNDGIYLFNDTALRVTKNDSGYLLNLCEEDSIDSNKCILIVDNNKFSSAVLSRYLARLGYTTKNVSSTNEAKDYLKSSIPHCMICDLEDSSGNVLDMIKHYRSKEENENKLPIFVFAKKKKISKRYNFTDAGVTAYIMKNDAASVLEKYLLEYL